MQKNIKPLSLEEAVEILQGVFPEEELKEWSARPEDKACLSAHFAGGMWVRNEWVYGSGCPLVDKIRAEAILIHDDDISNIIVRALWRVLNGKSCPSLKELL